MCCVLCCLLFVVFLCFEFLFLFCAHLSSSLVLFSFFLSSLFSLPLCILYQDVSCNGLTDGDFQYLTTSLMAAKASALQIILYENNNVTSSSLNIKKLEEILTSGKKMNESQNVGRSLK